MFFSKIKFACIRLCSRFIRGWVFFSIKTLIRNLVSLARFFKLCRSLVLLRVLCGFYLALALALSPLFPQCPLWSILVVAQPGCITILGVAAFPLRNQS